MSIYKGTTLIAGALPDAANQDLSNLSQTGQAVIDGKADTNLSNTTDNGKILMAGMAMPSETYIDLTLGASGTDYTAPANGWFVFGKTANSTNQYLALLNGKISITTFSPQSGNNIRIYIPALKNDNVRVSYSAGGATLVFRFYYAVGSESEAN